MEAVVSFDHITLNGEVSHRRTTSRNRCPSLNGRNQAPIDAPALRFSRRPHEPHGNSQQPPPQQQQHEPDHAERSSSSSVRTFATVLSEQPTRRATSRLLNPGSCRSSNSIRSLFLPPADCPCPFENAPAAFTAGTGPSGEPGLSRCGAGADIRTGAGTHLARSLPAFRMRVTLAAVNAVSLIRREGFLAVGTAFRGVWVGLLAALVWVAIAPAAQARGPAVLGHDRAGNAHSMTCSKRSAKRAVAATGVFDSPFYKIFGKYATPETNELFEVFGVYKVWCRDFTLDGRRDMAVNLLCCTVSSPRPLVVFVNTGVGWKVGWQRFNSQAWSPRAAGRTLRYRAPVYKRTDANCCPSRFRYYKLLYRHGRLRLIRLKAPRR